MDLFKFVLLMLYAMVHSNGTASTSNGNYEDMKVDVEVELKNLPAVPPGFRFAPSSSLLILDYLVKKILGVPLASDMVKVRDGIQQLDPEQHKFKEEFSHCPENKAYYITKQGQRKNARGESETSAIIETTSGYWREKKRDIPVYNSEDLIGYKKCYVFCRENDETSWLMDELTVNPEIISADAKNQIKGTIACRIRVKPSTTSDGSSSDYENLEEEDAEEFNVEEEEMIEAVEEN